MRKPIETYTVFWLVCIGVCIGWLMGLSITPVIPIVVTSIVGSVAAIVAALSGQQDDNQDSSTANNIPLLKRRINPTPLGLLLVGMILGSAVGVLARNQHWLGSDVSGEIKKWTDQGLDREVVLGTIFASQYPGVSSTAIPTETLATEINWWIGLGVPRDEATRRLFESRYPTVVESANMTPSGSPTVGTFLFSVDANTCESLLASVAMSKATSNNTLLRGAMASSPNEQVQQLAGLVPDSQLLLDIVEQVLCSDG